MAYHSTVPILSGLSTATVGAFKGRNLYLQAEATSLVVGVGQAIELKPAEHKPKLARLARIQRRCVRVHSGPLHRHKLPPRQVYCCLLSCNTYCICLGQPSITSCHSIGHISCSTSCEARRKMLMVMRPARSSLHSVTPCCAVSKDQQALPVRRLFSPLRAVAQPHLRLCQRWPGRCPRVHSPGRRSSDSACTSGHRPPPEALCHRRR